MIVCACVCLFVYVLFGSLLVGARLCDCACVWLRVRLCVWLFG